MKDTVDQKLQIQFYKSSCELDKDTDKIVPGINSSLLYRKDPQTGQRWLIYRNIAMTESFEMFNASKNFDYEIVLLNEYIDSRIKPSSIFVNTKVRYKKIFIANETMKILSQRKNEFIKELLKQYDNATDLERTRIGDHYYAGGNLGHILRQICSKYSDDFRMRLKVDVNHQTGKDKMNMQLQYINNMI